MKKSAPPISPRRGMPIVPAMQELRIGFGHATVLYGLLALLYFIPALLPGHQIYGTDYIGGGYFFYDFISQRLSSGALPKWVPYVFGGIPLFANPGSTFHPVHFFADLLFPTPRVLALVFLVQFWLAGIGMFLLARELGCRPWIAAIAGLAFQFTGILTSWVYAGHDGRIIVASLTPLFFHFLHTGVRTARVAPFAGAAATLGTALLSFQIQNSYYLLLAGGIWGVYCLVRWGRVRQPGKVAGISALALGAVVFGFVLAAVNFLPFLGYVPESPRGMEGGRGYEYSVTFSMPPSEILSMAVPEHHGASVAEPRTGRPLFPAYRGANPFKLHTEYVGALGVVLLALGLFYSSRDRLWWFFAGLGLFMMTIALGGHTPLYRLYFEVLPGTQRFRAPSLSFFVVAFSVVTMAALTLERLAQLLAREEASPVGRMRNGTAWKPLYWIIVGIGALAVLGMVATAGSAAAGGQVGPSVSGGWARFAFFFGLTGGAIWLWVKRKVGSRILAVTLAVITLADLWFVGRRFFHTVEPPEVIFAADDVIRFLRAQPQPNRTWVFPFPEHYRGAGAYGGNFPMLFGIEQVGGEHPNMLQRWVEYVGAGTRTYIDWHNLIEDAEVVSTSEGPAIAFRSQPGFLEAANIRYVVSMAPLAHRSLREVHRGSALVYENIDALPRAYLVPRVREVPDGPMIPAMRSGEWNPAQLAYVARPVQLTDQDTPLDGEAEIVTHEPDRVVVRVRANRPALLVLADNHFEGWQAHVDGRASAVLLVNNTFRGVVVPAGEYDVVFTFRPSQLYTGLWITGAASVLLLGFAAWLLVGYLREKHTASEEA